MTKNGQDLSYICTGWMHSNAKVFGALMSLGQLQACYWLVSCLSYSLNCRPVVQSLFEAMLLTPSSFSFGHQTCSLAITSSLLSLLTVRPNQSLSRDDSLILMVDRDSDSNTWARKHYQTMIVITIWYATHHSRELFVLRCEGETRCAIVSLMDGKHN